MMNFVMKLKASALFVIYLTTFACAAHGTTFKDAADEYCKLYAPNSWSSFDKNADLQDIYAFIAKKALEIENTKLVDAINDANKESFSAFFVSARANIEKSLGGAWKCEDFDNFFCPKQDVLTVSITGVTKKHISPNSPDTVIIMLLASGDIVINNNPLTNPSSDNIKKAISILSNDNHLSKTEVYLYFDEGADGARISELLILLNDLGIESIGLINYPK